MNARIAGAIAPYVLDHDESLDLGKLRVAFGEEQARNVERYLSAVPVGIDALIAWVNAVVPTMEKTDA